MEEDYNYRVIGSEKPFSRSIGHSHRKSSPTRVLVKDYKKSSSPGRISETPTHTGGSIIRERGDSRIKRTVDTVVDSSKKSGGPISINKKGSTNFGDDDFEI